MEQIVDLQPGFVRRRQSARKIGSVLEGENMLPVLLHLDDRPALLLRLVVQRLGEVTDLGVRHLGRDRRHTRASRHRGGSTWRAARPIQAKHQLAVDRVLNPSVPS
jgi:hypothetical protein